MTKNKLNFSFLNKSDQDEVEAGKSNLLRFSKLSLLQHIKTQSNKSKKKNEILNC